MSQTPDPQDPQDSQERAHRASSRREENAIWSIFGYLLSGLLFWGGVGWAADRFGTGALMPISLLPFAGGALIFAFAQQPFAAGFGFALLGLSSGAFSTVISAFWAEYYGTKFIGGIKAIGSAVMVFGSAMGPWLTGLAIDWGFGFDRQLVAVAVYFVATSLIVLSATRFLHEQ